VGRRRHRLRPVLNQENRLHDVTDDGEPVPSRSAFEGREWLAFWPSRRQFPEHADTPSEFRRLTSHRLPGRRQNVPATPRRPSRARLRCGPVPLASVRGTFRLALSSSRTSARSRSTASGPNSKAVTARRSARLRSLRLIGFVFAVRRTTRARLEAKGRSIRASWSGPGDSTGL
jgi:hypothetical protein